MIPVRVSRNVWLTLSVEGEQESKGKAGVGQLVNLNPRKKVNFFCVYCIKSIFDFAYYMWDF